MAGSILLTGCSSDGADTKELPSSSPDAATDAASPAAQDDSASAYTTPATCEALTLKAGATIPGKGLAACVVDAMEAYGTGTEYVLSNDQSGTARFRFGDDPAMAGENDGTGGKKTSYVFLGDEEWIKNDGSWVKGDPEGDSKAVMVASIAKLYRALADPKVTADVIGSSPTWKVEPEKDVIALENGENANALRIVSAEPFQWNGAKMSEYILWMKDDATPVGAQGTSTVGGVQSTTSQHFYDLGKPVTIEPPE
ncbi:hypothetical protein ACFVWY_01055 [Streptomyces sp. NPDC058195]|uniref:hypothetical protein n=1 Tax=Streptomyces sp. NPDC058195 TaxID=3346375 RepID=UPI0036E72E8D